MAEAAKAEANALYSSGRFAEAVVAFDKALALCDEVTPKLLVATLHANKAAALSGLNRLNEATEECVKAIAADATYSRAWKRLGGLIARIGKLDAALASSKRQVKQEPDNSDAAVLLRRLRKLAAGREKGNQHFAQQNWAGALQAYDEAIESAGEIQRPLSVLLLCNRAACHLKLGNAQKALDDAIQAVEIEGGYTKARMRKAAALADLGRMAEAVDEYSELRSQLPGDEEVAKRLYACKLAQARDAGEDTSKIASEEPGVIHVKDSTQYSKLVKSPGLVVVDFTASWCGPCRSIAPVVDRLALQFIRTHFLKVDVDEVQDVAHAEGVRSMPTFVFYRNGSKVDTFSGADPSLLASKVQALS